MNQESSLVSIIMPCFNVEETIARALIKNGTSEQLFEALSRQPWLSACNFYRRRFYQRIGDLGGKYRLVEDWPAHLIAARMGARSAKRRANSLPHAV